MPRSRSSEIAQRQSPRGPHPLRTSSSDSDPLHHRPIKPRGLQPDPLHQKKLGTRIADLESQLGQAQDELKILKDQLASAEAAKQLAQQELENKTKKAARPETLQISEETDVFEVELEKENVPEPVDEVGKETDLEAEKDDLKAKLEEKEKENMNLKNEVKQATSDIVMCKAKEEEMRVRMRQLEKEVEESRANAEDLKEKLEGAERAKEASEGEIKKMRVQTEQWRKAADAAAAVLESVVGSPELDDTFASGKRKGPAIKVFGDLWRKTGHK
ncbi:interactor of constitutive active ROPs 1-like [Euphorbia lathyris]|uniref:interactor of constitutive active ROPs 1-like n=1 Tax=Euphorbia lathyris TaxID=212925 RepID=UPI00331403C4